MFCSHCGKEVMDEAVICPHCGCTMRNMPQNGKEDAISIGDILLLIFLPLFAMISGFARLSGGREKTGMLMTGLGITLLIIQVIGFAYLKAYAII